MRPLPSGCNSTITQVKVARTDPPDQISCLSVKLVVR
jgi:hypothetical protein